MRLSARNVHLTDHVQDVLLDKTRFRSLRSLVFEVDLRDIPNPNIVAVEQFILPKMERLRAQGVSVRVKSHA